MPRGNGNLGVGEAGSEHVAASRPWHARSSSRYPSLPATVRGRQHAAALIAPLALAVQRGDTAGGLAAKAFPHPMISERIARAARDYRG